MKRILVIDDDWRIVTALEARLQNEGYEVLGAYDGLQGLAMAKDKKPDLILMDINMPAGDGFTVAERIHGAPATHSTPIIFLTASRRPGMRERADEVGAAAYFEKPFDSQDLVTAIRGALEVPSES